MSTGSSSSRAAVVSFAASALLHAAVVGGVGATPWLAERFLRSEPKPGAADESVRLPEAPSPLRLGLEDSTANTLTWVGFSTPTEHSAPEGESEQSAMSPNIAPPAPPEDQPEVAAA